MGGSCSDHLLKDLDQMHQLMPVADPGEGPGGAQPPLVFEKHLLGDAPPPLSEGLDRHCMHTRALYI